MARYKPYDYTQAKLLPITFSRQILPGTFEYTLHHIVEHELDLSIFESKYKNDETGAPAYDPAILLKIILYAYARGITSSREIEQCCRENVIFMAARKFGTTGSEHLSWAVNTQLPALVADRYRNSRIVCFSSGNVYPLVPAVQGGATEETPVAPQGEYAQSVLGRERVFEHASHRWGTKIALLRLNYAIDLRYGVLVIDLAGQ